MALYCMRSLGLEIGPMSLGVSGSGGGCGVLVSGSGAGLGGVGLAGGPISCGRLGGCAPGASEGWAEGWAALPRLDDMLDDAASDNFAWEGVALVEANPVGVELGD